MGVGAAVVHSDSRCPRASYRGPAARTMRNSAEVGESLLQSPMRILIQMITRTILIQLRSMKTLSPGSLRI